MMNFENKIFEKELSPEEVFVEHFPSGSIRDIAESELPAEVAAYFEGRTTMYINPKDWTPGRAVNFKLISHENGTDTFTAEETKEYEKSKKELLTYFYDRDEDGKKLGHGELRWAIDDKRKFFKDKPFVGYTHSDIRRAGLGERRLKYMNAYAQMRFGKPLYSSDLFVSADAEGKLKPSKLVWEKLVAMGVAEEFLEENGKMRYCFKV